MSTPDQPIARALARLPASLYGEHLDKRPTSVYSGTFLGGQWGPCRCSDAGPDGACEVGEALWRMKQKEGKTEPCRP